VFSSRRLSASCAVGRLVSLLLNTGHRPARCCSNRPTRKQPRLCARGGVCDALSVEETPLQTKCERVRSDWSLQPIGARSGRAAGGHRNGCSSSAERPLSPTDSHQVPMRVRCVTAPHPHPLSNWRFVCLRSDARAQSTGAVVRKRAEDIFAFHTRGPAMQPSEQADACGVDAAPRRRRACA
jgi:hypothetical protein